MAFVANRPCGYDLCQHRLLGRTAMTSVSHAQGPHDSDVAPLRAKSGWIIALGVVYVIAGLIALSSVALATVASVVVVGVMMLIAGVAEVINAFPGKGGRTYVRGGTKGAVC